jgi:hypothetical protein
MQRTAVALLALQIKCSTKSRSNPEVFKEKSFGENADRITQIEKKRLTSLSASSVTNVLLIVAIFLEATNPANVQAVQIIRCISYTFRIKYSILVVRTTVLYAI